MFFNCKDVTISNECPLKGFIVQSPFSSYWSTILNPDSTFAYRIETPLGKIPNYRCSSFKEPLDNLQLAVNGGLNVCFE